MYIGDVLKKVEGLTKRDLYYWEDSKLINPKKLKRGKLEFRIYSERDLEKIQKIYKYVKQGFTPKIAAQKALDESRLAGPPNLELSLSDFIFRWEWVLAACKPLGAPADYIPKDFQLTGIKKSNKLLQKFSELLFYAVRDLKFDLILPDDGFSYLVAGGLASMWEEFSESTFDIICFSDNFIEKYKDKSLKALIIFEGAYFEARYGQMQTEKFASELKSALENAKAMDIEIVKIISILPNIGVSEVFYKDCSFLSLTNEEDFDKILDEYIDSVEKNMKKE